MCKTTTTTRYDAVMTTNMKRQKIYCMKLVWRRRPCAFIAEIHKPPFYTRRARLQRKKIPAHIERKQIELVRVLRLRRCAHFFFKFILKTKYTFSQLEMMRRKGSTDSQIYITSCIVCDMQSKRPAKKKNRKKN